MMHGRCDGCKTLSLPLRFTLSSNPLGYNELLDRMDYEDVFFFCSRDCMEEYLQCEPDL